MKTKCVIIEDEPIARDIIRNHLAKLENFEVLAEFKKPTEALVFLSENKVDLIFLDINLPEVNGIEFAKSLTNPPAIIFTTAYREYAPEGFELHAIDYLLKPISFERFIKAINHYLKLSEKQNSTSKVADMVIENQRYIFLRDGKKTHKVNLADINYIESDGDYLKFYLKNKKVMIRGSLVSWEKTLPKELFIRIHNSYIVAIEKISSITSHSCEVAGVELPISRSHKEFVLQKLNIKE